MLIIRKPDLSSSFLIVTQVRTDDPRIRVLTLTRDVAFALGGAERLAYEFALRLNPTRFHSSLCLTRAPDSVHAEATAECLAQLRAAGVEVLRLDRRSSLALSPWLRLYSFMVRERIDIVHAHMPRASVPGTIIARLARVPVVVSHEHGWSFQGKPVRRFLDRHVVARGSDVMLAVSQWDRENLIDVERIPAERVRVLPHGIPPLPETSLDVRGELAQRSDVGLVGAVGRLFPEKGYDDLIRAIALLRDDGCMVSCVIVGGGPEEPALRALIRDLGVEENVHLLGYRQDVPDVIRALDVAVLTSRHEGSPLAVMEYMACGAPIVATAVGGVPELIEDGVHGLLVPPCDPGALADAIRRLLGDRELARRLGDAARQRQRAEFDVEAALRRLEGLYEELYERSVAARAGGSHRAAAIVRR